MNTSDLKNDILREFVQLDPIVSDPEEGLYCFFCGVHWRSIKPITHAPACLWLKAQAIAEELRTDGV